MFNILNSSFEIIVVILATIGFVSTMIAQFGHDTSKESAKLYGDLSLLFMGIGLTMLQLNYGPILIVTLAATSIVISEKKSTFGAEKISISLKYIINMLG
ncbi:hypothetical protein FE407_08145 [Leuconostoc carnosum]|uniref:hypothetical protein n=1 Tax=Leuconostoc TaxID=1243 RepID=UPI000D51E95F|nr:MULTISPECIES: hypothetical protein [Leuconostoc]KAA8324548.1 hypothetical protein FE404_07660 [Leuconostoc carnosum]KAA8358221.1 hypothetical protein FE407_08145 [Leuconostoc carnosum]KAA8364719.1 hypothetical protein FE406_08140 [Leuconostoc carnosum]KAA8365592.1 hypothetical protein FE416_08450 [Leuconostoc carnosum]KAA8371620.1 hypothetical protein FE415_08640 [Leuconostoc carnosum]